MNLSKEGKNTKVNGIEESLAKRNKELFKWSQLD